MRGFRLHTSVLIAASVAWAGCDSGGPSVLPPDLPPRAYFDQPAWHPDGRYVAAEHTDSVDTDGDGRLDDLFFGIWLVDVETGRTQPLLRGFGAPSWSPDGRRLAVDGGGHIHTVDVPSLAPARADTLSLRQLTTEGSSYYPSWSPDGEWIAYDNTDCGSPGTMLPPSACGILVTRLDGADRHLLVRGRVPDWSSDGYALTFVGLFKDVYRVDVATTSPVVRLTNDNYAYDIDAPKSSPSGDAVAFVSERGGQAAVWSMATDGTNQRQVSPRGAYSFDWSPDGRRLVFLYLQDYCGSCGETAPPGNGELWLVNADGTSPRQLTHASDS